MKRNDKILRAFMEWHLNQYFIPFDPRFVIHKARWEGYLGARIDFPAPSLKAGTESGERERARAHSGAASSSAGTEPGS